MGGGIFFRRPSMLFLIDLIITEKRFNGHDSTQVHATNIQSGHAMLFTSLQTIVTKQI